ncbi:helix-turn-helix domain-containing protein [Nocardioides humilatus]|uniref:helix-turn-helix domain-containing protein n=1 Tax=Nocardioides humilatus TaxID=2607660 RepID=UPI00165FBBDE|nr:helix-turn-helix transcriptional regulator [Nocardioides humilatus]
MGDVRALWGVGEGPPPADVGVATARSLAEDGRWREAHTALAAIPGLEAADLELRGTLAYLLGDARSYFEDLAAAFTSYDDPARAARCACWLGIMHLIRGEAGHSAGWMASARRLVDEHGESAASAYLEVMAILGDESAGRDQAIAIARVVNDIARRHGDEDATALTGQTLGQLLIRTGSADEGRRLMDEAMVSASSRQLSSPLVEILVYLAVMAGCRLLMDLGRAREWTTAVNRLRARSPELTAFAGVLAQCRAELHQVSGEWEAALAELDTVTDRPLLGEVAYLRGEILRRQGDYDDAAAAYAQAAAAGRDTAAGVAALHLAKGEPAIARALTARSLAELTDACDRVVLLPVAVAAAAPTSVSDAAVLAAELEQIANLLDSPLLQARAHQAAGVVALAQGDPASAVVRFRQGCIAFGALAVPAELATCHADAAAAYRAQGDDALADLELAAAVALADRIGLRLPEQPSPEPGPGTTIGTARLSTREVDVLRRVAAGATNREIADELVLSPRTVDRHVSNILTKLGVSTRAAAASVATEHGLV